MTKRFIIVDTYYSAFLSSLYDQHKDLKEYPYIQQKRVLLDQCFGTSNFYSANLEQLGYEASDIIANCEPLQRQWAKEHGIKGSWVISKRAGLLPWLTRAALDDWFSQVLIEQIKYYQPDVLHVQDMNAIGPVLLQEIRPYVRLLTGQIACPISPNADFRQYDLVLSSFPHFVELFRKAGLNSQYFRLGFEPTVLKHLTKQQTHQTVFVGGLSSSHAERISFLEDVAESCSLDIWGYGIEATRPQSPLRTIHRGNVWALEMYQILYNSEIAINHHINDAERYANNMRLYEATGVGTLLLTDFKENLNSFFEIGKEILVYRSPDECKELISYYSTHPAERKSIARAGQERTLQEHTYYHRMKEFTEIIDQYIVT